MGKLESEAEKTIKKMVKRRELEILSDNIFNEVLEEVEQDMEEYRIIENYKKGISLIDINKVYLTSN